MAGDIEGGGHPLSAAGSRLRAARAQQDITIDAQARATPLPHFWEQMFGSGHANLALREAYRDDLAAVKTVTEMQYVRFHGILDDENGVYTEDEHGSPRLQLHLCRRDLRWPARKRRAARGRDQLHAQAACRAIPAPHAFWYNPNVSPPQRLRAMGRAHPRLRAEPGRPLWHRRSLAMVFRSLERAQHRLLGRRSRARPPTSSSTATPRAR